MTLAQAGAPAASPTPTLAIKSRTVRAFDERNVVGAGFLLTPEWVLTCAHLLERYPDLSFVTMSGESLARRGEPVMHQERLVLTSFSMWPDIALLPVVASVNELWNPIAFDLSTPSEDDQLLVAGFPTLGGSNQFTTEVCETITLHGDNEEYIQSRAGWIREGFSGGPVYSSKLQALVGFVVGSRDPSQESGGLFVGLSHVSERSKDLGLGEPAVIPTLPSILGRPPDIVPKAASDFVASRVGVGGVAVLATPSLQKGLELQTDLALSFFSSVETDADRRVWVNLDRSGGILDLVDVVDRMGLTCSRSDPEEIEGAVRSWLETTDESWLLVLHGVSEPGQVQGLIPDGGEGCTVVTTKSPPWWSLGDVLHVPDALGDGE